MIIKLVKNEFLKVKLSRIFFSQIIILVSIYIINKYSNNYLLDDIFKLVPFIGIIVCILFSGIICGEVENGTLRYYLTKPYKRWKIYLSKLITIYLYLTITIIIVNLFSFMLIKVFSINHLSKYFIYNIPNYLISTLILYLSTTHKNQSLCVGISIFVLSFSLIISQILFGFNFNIIEYTFLPYLDYSIFDNKISLEAMNSELNINLSLNKAIIIDSISIVIFYLLGNYKFNKKDIKN